MLVLVEVQIALRLLVLGTQDTVSRGELGHDQPASAKVPNEAAEHCVGHSRHGGKDRSRGEGDRADFECVGNRDEVSRTTLSTGGDARAYIGRIVPKLLHLLILVALNLSRI